MTLKPLVGRRYKNLGMSGHIFTVLYVGKTHVMVEYEEDARKGEDIKFLTDFHKYWQLLPEQTSFIYEAVSSGAVHLCAMHSKRNLQLIWEDGRLVKAEVCNGNSWS